MERLLAANFPASVFLSPGRSADLLRHLGRAGVTGGAVYDALVGAAAAEHGRRLLTRDRRAAPVYRGLGVDVELLD